MNKSLAAALMFFFSVTLLSISLPSENAEAGFRRHRCQGGTRARCEGRHRMHRRDRCHGGARSWAGCHGDYSGVGCAGYHGSEYGGCHGGGGPYAPEDAYLAPPDTPAAPHSDERATPQGAGVDASSPSDTEANSALPPPPSEPQSVSPN
jgi:hypothetical protein